MPYAEIAKHAREASVEVCWAQWASLGGSVSQGSGPGARSVIDPEALVAASLYLHPQERRLLDLVGWWSDVGSRLISIQRLRTVAGGFPDPGIEPVRAFGRMAAQSGDRRWPHARSVREISLATGYSDVAIRSAVQDMALGRVIREIPGHPTRYFAPEGIGSELLAPDSSGPFSR